MNLKLYKIIKGFVFYALIIAVWYAAWVLFVRRLGVLNGKLFLSPFEVIITLFGLIFQNDNSFWLHLGMSLARLGIGFLMSLAVGIILSVIILSGKLFSDDIKSLLTSFQSLPNICWVPLAIIFCGIDEKAVYFVMVFGSAPSIALSISSSISNIDPIYIRAGKTLGCNKIGMITRILVPAALPNIVIGLRQGWAFSWRALMAGEMNCLVSASSFGAGFLMEKLRQSFTPDTVIGIMIVLMLIGVFFEKTVFGKIENKLLLARGIMSENEDN